ncbi:MAG: DUF4465 domain-containing protein [Candidatus Cryptobacteroides sp.]
MKRFILAVIAAFLLTSCFKNSYSETTYPLCVTFEYSNPSSLFESDSVYYATSFSFDVLCFNNKVADEKTFQGGFALSIARDTTLNLQANPFSMYASSASYGSETCAIFRSNANPSGMPEHAITFLGAENGTCTPTGCYICNTTEVATAILHEDSPYKFKSGEDYYKLIATGYKDNIQTGKAEFYLADWRTKDSLALGWQPFDLSALGVVDAVDFSIESTVEGIPSAFCLDNFIASIYLKY